jgi:hypothetical protein
MPRATRLPDGEIVAVTRGRRGGREKGARRRPPPPAGVAGVSMHDVDPFADALDADQ